LFTVNQAAEKLNLDTSQVRRLLRSGKLKGQKWGRDWMVTELNPKNYSRENVKITSMSSSEIIRDSKYSRKDVINLLNNTPILAGIDASKFAIIIDSFIIECYHSYKKSFPFKKA
jgi:excisionase family DNA binding protein